MYSFRKWIVQVILLIAILFTAIGLFNAFMDPLWIFGNKHPLNKYQFAFNERIMKTNEMTYQPFPYDSLMLGNSRTTYIDPREFNSMHVYNYAASSLDIEDYGSMITYAKQQRGSEFDTIILALDYLQVKVIQEDENISKIIDNSQDSLYVIKSLLSEDTIRYSIENLVMSLGNNHGLYRNYGHDNYALSTKRSEKKMLEYFAKQSAMLKIRLSENKDMYVESYQTFLREIKANNPNTTFIIYTPIVSSAYMQAIQESGDLDDYRRWLKETVEIFGEVHHFMYDHSAAREPMNFQDASHFNNRVGVWIAHKLSGVPDAEIPADFGMILNEANIDEYLTQF